MDGDDLVALVISSLSLLVSGVALWVAVWVGRRQRQFHGESLRNLREEREARSRADIRFDRGRASIGSWQALFLKNEGRGAANAVHFSADPEDGLVSPFVPSDLERKIPIERLGPGEKLELLLSFRVGQFKTSRKLTVDLSWTDDDGERRTRRQSLAL